MCNSETLAAGATVVQAIASVFALAVTVWLVAVTRKYARATDRTVAVMTRTADLQERPCVVLDFVRPAPMADTHFVAVNCGLGNAVNAFEISNPGDDEFTVRPLGSVLASSSIVVPDSLQTELATQLIDPLELSHLYVCAQAVHKGPWILSENVMSKDHRLTHTSHPWSPSEAQLQKLFPETPNEAIQRIFTGRPFEPRVTR